MSEEPNARLRHGMMDARKGFLYERITPDGRLIGVLPLLFGRARLGIGRLDDDGFDDVWDFPARGRAIVEADTWNPETEPEPSGWDRHPKTGRRRVDGNPAREYREDEG